MIRMLAIESDGGVWMGAPCCTAAAKAVNWCM
jgi:hypothetical protein